MQHKTIAASLSLSPPFPSDAHVTWEAGPAALAGVGADRLAALNEQTLILRLCMQIDPAACSGCSHRSLQAAYGPAAACAQQRAAPVSCAQERLR